jgi:hypothetical protein
MANITKRNNSQPGGTDAHAVESLTYNEPAGSRKVSEVGRSLLPIPKSSATPPFTTNVTTQTNLPAFGMNFAVYNNSSTVGSVNVGLASNGITTLAPGIADANGSVGIPCAPNSWTYIAAGSNNCIIASGATLLVFMIEDPTTITVVSKPNAST